MQRALGLALLAAAGVGLWGCDSGPADSGAANPWRLPGNTASVALFQVDFLTNQLEGGVLLNFSAQADSVSPFAFTTRAPGDFGWSLVRYAATADTLFFGETIWLGCGERHVPHELLPPGRLGRIAGTPPVLQDLEYFIPAAGEFPDPDAAHRAADAAWASLHEVNLVQAFAGRAPRAAVLFYSRCEGLFNPARADWIVLLYAGKEL